MSLKYEILRRRVKVVGIKRFFTGNRDELIERRKKKNAGNSIPDIKDNDFIVSRTDVTGFPVLKMIHKKHTDKAELYIIGGGMISAPKPAAIKQALKFAKETGLDLFIPYYPLCTDYSLPKAYEMILETYKLMLNEYRPENISFLGYSSGGNLALGMVSYINDGHSDVPMPGHIMLLSPGTCVDTPEEWRKMQEIDSRDVVTPAVFMKTAKEIMCHGGDYVPEYMLWLQKGNYRNCPPATIFYGTDECLYACASGIESALKKYNADYKIIAGEGMFHCYPMFPICREANEGWDAMIGIIKNW